MASAVLTEPVWKPDERGEIDLLDVLHARHGIICAVGAGGKKTTLYALARCHPGRIGITSTVMLPPFPRTLAAQRVITDAPMMLPKVVAAAQQHRVVAFAQQCIDLDVVSKTVCGRDTAVKPTGMYSRRVLITMSRSISSPAELRA